MQFPCSSLPWSINGHESCQKLHIVTQEVSHKTSFVFLKTKSWYLGIFWLFCRISYMLFFILHNDVMILGALLYEISDCPVSFSKMRIVATLIIQIISFYQFSLQSTPQNEINWFKTWKLFKICRFQVNFATFRLFLAILTTDSSIFRIYDLINIAGHRLLDRVKDLSGNNLLRCKIQ